MNVERIGLGDLRAERLALAQRVQNVFATPEFHETWWRHFGGGRELLLQAVFDGERLAGVLPLYRRRGIRRFLGHGGGDELGPVAAAADRDAVAAAMPRAGLVICEHVRPEWRAAVGGRTVLREGSPALRIAGSWDDYLATRSSNFRGIVRNKPRRLERDHETRFRLADADSLDRDLDTLFSLHRARWQRPSTFGAREAFHRDFARVGLERGWTRLVVLEVDGRAAAAWYGFRFGDVDSYYQSGRDPSFERESVGLVLLAYTIRSAFEDGRSEYRFLRGDEPYKYRFTDDDSFVETAVTGPAAPAVAAAARAFRVSRAGARRLRRSLPRARAAGASRPGA